MKKRQSLTSYFSPVASKKNRLENEESTACPFCGSLYSSADIESHVEMHIVIEDEKADRKKAALNPSIQASVPSSTGVCGKSA